MDPAALDQMFRAARTPVSWSSRPVTEDVVRALYELVKWGPTSANCSPARFIFLTSRESRGMIRHALSAPNIERFMDAPLGVVICQDPIFFDHLPELNPEENLRDWFASDVGLAEETAFRNATLQGGYLIMAARALGLAAWPISGFDSDDVEDALMAETGWRANFLMGIGYSGETRPPARAPRLDFHAACRLF
ncbi:MAG: malonic semialdehyde reductase [Acetobacteraceae bacterium]